MVFPQWFFLKDSKEFKNGPLFLLMLITTQGNHIDLSLSWGAGS